MIGSATEWIIHNDSASSIEWLERMWYVPSSGLIVKPRSLDTVTLDLMISLMCCFFCAKWDSMEPIPHFKNHAKSLNFIYLSNNKIAFLCFTFLYHDIVWFVFTWFAPYFHAHFPIFPSLNHIVPWCMCVSSPLTCHSQNDTVSCGCHTNDLGHSELSEYFHAWIELPTCGVHMSDLSYPPYGDLYPYCFGMQCSH